MIPFDYQPRTRIVFGPGAVEQLGALAGEMGVRRALLVSDPGIVAAGHADRSLESLRKAGIDTHLFSDVAENPSTDHVAAGVVAAKRYEVEMIVGLGGGSSMDCAKGVNFIVSGGGRMQDYWGVGKMTRPMLPMIAVPTTAGTGSETQSFALISDSATHVKMACGDKKASFRAAILDPELTVSQPPRVTALTGIDAIAHALETYVTTKRNSVSLAFSREAWRLLSGNFAKVMRKPDDLDARGAMQLGACFAGLAIENSMLGAAHACANPLTAHYGVVHGQAIAVMLPHVVRYNGEEHGELYRELLASSGAGAPGPDRGPEGLADYVRHLASLSGLSTKLSECGVERGKLSQMADDAASQWTGGFNPRPVAAEQMLALYESAF